MLTEEQGIKAVMELQALGGIEWTEEQAKAGWNGMAEWEKGQTEAAHKTVCGGFKEEDEKPV